MSTRRVNGGYVNSRFYPTDGDMPESDLHYLIDQYEWALATLEGRTRGMTGGPIEMVRRIVNKALKERGNL